MFGFGKKNKSYLNADLNDWLILLSENLAMVASPTNFGDEDLPSEGLLSVELDTVIRFINEEADKLTDEELFGETFQQQMLRLGKNANDTVMLSLQKVLFSVLFGIDMYRFNYAPSDIDEVLLTAIALIAVPEEDYNCFIQQICHMRDNANFNREDTWSGMDFKMFLLDALLVRETAWIGTPSVLPERGGKKLFGFNKKANKIYLSQIERIKVTLETFEAKPIPANPYLVR